MEKLEENGNVPCRLPRKGSDGTMEPTKNSKSAAIKAVVLGIFIIAAVGVLRFTPAREYITADSLGRLLNAAGFWAPVAFVFIYAAGICLFVPGLLLTTLGAAVFGPYLGFLYVMAGAVLGASLAFWIGRTLGRDFAASLIGDRLRKYDEAIERNGFATVLYLRLIYLPFHSDELRHGSDQGPVRGLFLGQLRWGSSWEPSSSRSSWEPSRRSGSGVTGRGCLPGNPFPFWLSSSFRSLFPESSKR